MARYSHLQVLSWLVVIFRLHTRLRVVREPGWDDLFVFLAALVNLISVVSFLGGNSLLADMHHIVLVLTIFQVPNTGWVNI